MREKYSIIASLLFLCASHLPVWSASKPLRLFSGVEKLIDLKGNDLIFLSKGSLHYRSLKKRRKRVVTTSYGIINSAAKLSPAGRYVAFAQNISKKKERHQLHIFDTKIGHIILTTKPIKKFLSLNWSNNCTVMLHTSERIPIKLYKFTFSRTCKRTSKNFYHLVFRKDVGNWLIGPPPRYNLLITPWKESISNQRKSSSKAIVVELTKGGIFYFMPSPYADRLHRQDQKAATTASISPSGKLVAYSTAADKIFIWNIKNNKKVPLTNGTTPLFVNNNELLYVNKDSVFRLKL